MAKRSDFAEEMGSEYARLGANLDKIRGKGAVGATVEEAEKLVKSTQKEGKSVSEEEKRAKNKRMAMIRSGGVQKKACGGKVRKMAKGGPVCRGMGAATRGGRYGKDG